MSGSTPATEPTAERVADMFTESDNDYHDGWYWKPGISADGNVVSVRITPYSEDGDECDEKHFEAYVFAVEPATPVADGPVTLPVDDARELLDYQDVGGGCGGWTVVAVTQTGSSRWHSTHRIVIRNEAGEHFAAYFQQGLTEQQHTEPWDGQEAVMFNPVVARPKVVRTVEWVKPADRAKTGDGQS